MVQQRQRLDEGTWLAYPTTGTRAGEGGDAYAVRYFGNTPEAELKALHYANDNPGYRAIYIVAGESILDAEGHRD